MTINHQPKAAMNAAKGSAGAAGPATAPAADNEVVPRARRRHFSNADKRRILAAADRCTKPGEIGALMRREGVYSSSLSTWRRQRDAVELAALEPQKRGLYAGAIGYFGYNGNLDTCIVIRTIVMKGKKVFITAGAGIVADSDPKMEYQETLNKARAMLKAVELAEQWRRR